MTLKEPTADVTNQDQMNIEGCQLATKGPDRTLVHMMSLSNDIYYSN
jgi:hypothetical protein